MMDAPAWSNIGLSAALGASALVSAAVAAPPPALMPPPGNAEYLVLEGAGTQNYRCQSAGGSPHFVFIGPQAVFSRQGMPMVRNDQSAVPGVAHDGLPGCFADATGTTQLCPRFRAIADRSMVWGIKVAGIAGGGDPGCPDAGGVACLLLRIVAAGPAPGLVSGTTFVQRLETRGGLPPAGACTPGAIAAVPYTATYHFLRKADRSAGTP